MSERQLFVFWQFNGDNSSQCNQKCPYCYGGIKENKHYWSGDIDKWEKAWERLGRDIYFVFSYGESLCAKGFYECVEMIGRHPTWTLCIVSNMLCDPSRLIESRLACEGRLFISACWHPLGVENRVEGWENFKTNILKLKAAGVPMNVMYLWYPPQIGWFPEYFRWLDSNDFRVSVRRFVGAYGGVKLPFSGRRLGGKCYPRDYSEAEQGYIYAYSSPKVAKYGLRLVPPKGKFCTAGKDLILVKYNGDVSLCADTENTTHLGNIFDADFKLSPLGCVCPNNICGGDYGMLHLFDPEFGDLPERLTNEPFVSQVMSTKQSHPVQYKKREEMLFWIDELRKEGEKKK